MWIFRVVVRHPVYPFSKNVFHSSLFTLFSPFIIKHSIGCLINFEFAPCIVNSISARRNFLGGGSDVQQGRTWKGGRRAAGLWGRAHWTPEKISNFF